jgi:capsular exopolysaccharide synthesis family protein
LSCQPRGAVRILFPKNGNIACVIFFSLWKYFFLLQFLFLARMLRFLYIIEIEICERRKANALEIKERPRLSPELKLSYDIKHYLDLLRRRKWYLIILIPLAVVLCMVLGLKYFSERPTVEASALIGFESASDESGVKELGASGDNRSELIKSKLLLSEVVAALGLQLNVSGFQRSEVFDSVRVDSAAPEGNYRISIDRYATDAFGIYYANSDRGNRDTLLWHGNLPYSSLIDCPLFHLSFAKPFLEAPHEIRFSIISARQATENLYNSLKVTATDEESRHSTLSVTVKGWDAPLITKCANAVAAAFVQRKMALRKMRNQNLLEVLEKQLESTRTELEASEAELRKYRESHPTVGLDKNAQQTVAGLSQVETGISLLKSSLDEAQALIRKYSGEVDNERKIQTAGEMLGFLTSKNAPYAASTQSILQQALAERTALQNNYSADHPLVQKNRQRIEDIEKSILDNITNYIDNTAKSVEGSSRNASAISLKLRALPNAELQLAQLQRRQQIAADIYAAVLNRYNQAKVTTGVTMSEVYIMDNAVEPIAAPYTLKSVFFLLCLAALIGVTLVAGPIVIADKLDKSVHCESDLQLRTAIPLLESIPRMSSLNKPKPHEANEKTASGLKEAISRPWMGATTPVSLQKDSKISDQLFRSLCMKLLLKLHSAQKKSIVITSLESGAGKSTMAANIAIMMARQNHRTLLIDGDLHCGVLSSWFSIPREPGLSNFLTNGTDITSETIDEIIWETHVDLLWMMNGGKPVFNASELLASPRFESIVSTAAAKFDVVIFDAPPLGPVTDAVIVNKCFSGYAIVAKAGQTNIDDLMSKISEYPVVAGKIAGLIFNHANLDGKMKYYQDKYYSV